VQAGGEVFGHGHESYRELVAELGMEVQPSYVADPGEMTWGLLDGVLVGDQPPWMSDLELADLARVEQAFATLSLQVDPDDPWAHPQAAALDATSVGEWLRSEGALAAVRRRYELASLSLSCDGPERTSLLAELRKHAVLGGERFYDLEQWEGLRVSEGSAAVALRMASELGARVRLNSVVRRLAVKSGSVRVTLADGELVEAEAVVCAISGVTDARLSSLRALRHALAAKVVVSYDSPFWQDNGQNGLAETEWLFGSTWPQGPGVLSLLVPPERLSAFLAAPAPARAEAVLDGLARLYGERARLPGALLERAWGVDPFTRGYITSWAPGDVSRVGPLHGTHEPPFYVAGSDHWVAGYMEGAVRTGRAAARAALGAGSPV
jgi:monoamine oxidase